MKGRSRWRFIKLKNYLCILEILEIEMGQLILKVYLFDNKYGFCLVLEKDGVNEYGCKYIVWNS